MSPTVLRTGPYRFFFFSGDRGEPAHVHVERDDCLAKFWLNPVRLHHSTGFKRAEILKIQKLVEKEQVHFLNKWNEFFNY